MSFAYTIRNFTTVFTILTAFGLVSCSPFTSQPVPGPDKQFVGTWWGALTGAGAGAVTGFEVSAAAGPGAWIGAGFGSIHGLLSGLGIDLLEENALDQQEEQRRLRELSWVQEVLAEHYSRRMELHPSRDIFPADWFFRSDGVLLTPEGHLLAKEVASLTQRRVPWSRIVVAAYSTSRSKDSAYASHVTRRRAEAIANEFVRAGMEPRRVHARAFTLQEPVLIDPDDYPGRYRQAIEIIPLDY